MVVRSPEHDRSDARASASLEFASPAEIAAAQKALLQRHVRYAAAQSPFYRRMFTRLGLEPGAIKDTHDLAALPFTTKGDLEEHHDDFLCLNHSEIVDVCLTSGTTGKPVAMLQSSDDLVRLGLNEELSFLSTGIDRDDRVIIAAAMDRCFMAGLAYFLGLTRIGATVIRGGSSTPPLLAELITTCRPTAIVGVPSLLLAVGESIREDGGDPAQLCLRKMICIGEPVRTPDLALSTLGRRLAECWDTRVFGTYASTEMATTFPDCEWGMGGHIHPGLIVVEIVDDKGRVVLPGEAGEVVATPLGVTGMPLIRFKTGDIATLHAEPCHCGRNSWRLGPVIGRKCQMLKYRGTTVYPPAIYAVLEGLPAVRGYYVEVRSAFDLSDDIRVVAGTADGSLTAAEVADRIAAAIRVRPAVVLVSPEEIARVTLREGKRKPVTFFDYRTRRVQD